MSGGDLPEGDLPDGIGRVARRELGVHGITRLDQVTTKTPAQLLAIQGVGPKAVRLLGEALAARGQSFAD